MDIKRLQQIADGLMPDIVKGPAAFRQQDPSKDIIRTTKREGNKIVVTEQYPDEQKLAEHEKSFTL